MPSKTTLLCKVGGPSPDLLFQEVIGFPLLLRNILTLNKLGCRDIRVALPPSFHQEFEAKISEELLKRGIFVTLENSQKLSAQMDIENQIIPAHALIEEKNHLPAYSLIIDRPEMIAVAQNRLLENIRLAALGPVARQLNKKISLPISLRLAKKRIHPNWVSFFNIVLGYSTGFFVAQGSYSGYFLGGFLFQMASIFDGCDGELAKLTFKTNKMGEYLDTISDNGTLLSFFAGLMFAFSREHPPWQTLTLSLLLAGGLGLLFWQVIYFLKKKTDSASLATFDKEYLSKFSSTNFLGVFLKKGKILMRKDGFSFVFFVLALLGVLPWLIPLTIGGTWIANTVLLLLKLNPQLQTQEIPREIQ